MFRPAILAIAFVLAAPASANTYVANVNGIQAGPGDTLDRFVGIVVGKDGRIVQLVRATDEKRPAGITRTIDGKGRTLLPGLIDAHAHLLATGLVAIKLDLTGTASLADMQARLKAYAAANPGKGWIVGRGWNQENWTTRRFPTAADLDAVVADRPVVLERVDGHAYVVNGAALRAASIDARTPEVAGGRIERDARGNPTGLLVDKAGDRIEALIPAPDEAQRAQALAKAQDIMLGFGLTAVADMGTSVADWQLLHHAGEDGRLRIRVMAYSFGIEPIEQIGLGGPSPWLHGDRLRMGGVKLYADGALGSRGAWLKRGYADRPATRGLPRFADADLRRLTERAAGLGYQVAIHAIGDAANAQAIAIFERLSRRYGKARRWRIEHAQVVDPADIRRFAPAGIIASMQPTHQTSDRLMAEARLGPNRLGGAYAWKSIVRSGARIALGSDTPVESANPFPGLAAAISRQDMAGEPQGGWRPAERLTLARALAGFTRDAAFAGFGEARFGTLAPGHWADFIIVDRDIAAVGAQALARTQVLETWVAGERQWARAITATAR